jgi:hydrogenase maturation factor
MLPVGKLPVDLLRDLLVRVSRYRDPSVVVGSGIGLDAAVIRFGRRLLVAKTDPITFVADDIGAYALLVNANDLAVMGATPKWFLTTVLLPSGSTRGAVETLFARLHAQCRRLNVSLCGGHTEVTPAVTRPIVVGCLLGECARKRVVTAAGARVGDAVLLTKGLAIEAVSILARERADEVRERFGAQFLARCRRYLQDPGLSVVKEARLALSSRGVHAMHDPTEGGLSAALYELAEAADVGLAIDAAAIPVLPEAARLSEVFKFDPFGAIASGALLICADPRQEPKMTRRFRTARIPIARIGTVAKRSQGMTLREAGRTTPLPKFEVDELARLFQK